MLKVNTLCRIFELARRPALAVLLPALLAAAPALAAAPPPPTAAPLSLEFIQNKGQWPAATRLLAPLPNGGKLVLEAQGLAYVLTDAAGLARFVHPHGAAAEAPATGAADKSRSFRQHAYRVAFVGARADLQPVATQPTAEVRNYFLGADEARWAAGVGSFRQVMYPAVWPGIAVVLRENAAQHLEYDLLLAPRADPARAVLRYAGTDGLRLDAGGNLIISTSVGTVRELAPQAWQTGPDGQRQPVPCRFVLAGNELRFALGRYNRRRPLTIDPTVVFSSSTGSTADNWGFTATYDQAGNLYSGGIVISDQGGAYPATGGAFSTQFSSVVDMAFIKYNTAVSGPAARVWATYLGGNDIEFPHSLVVNAQNELVILGSTSSSNYPTTAGAVGRSFSGGPFIDPLSDGGIYTMPNGADLIITRISALGDRLRASTYLGGSGNDGAQASFQLVRNYGDCFRGDVLLDGAGTVYVASNTNSRNFPGLPAGPGGQYRGGTSDGLLCVLPPALSSVSSRLFGGGGSDAAYSIQRDATGRIFVAGGTASPDFPTTAGAWQPTAPGSTDGFVARFDPGGQVLQAATYVGTPAYDQMFFVQVDNDGEPYLLGQTQGRPPLTAGCYAVPGGGEVVYKLDPDLQLLRYATTFGKSQGTSLVPTAFLVDECERVYVCGWGGRVNATFLGGDTYGLPTAGGPVQAATDGSDFYLAQFTPGMRQLEYASYLGELGGLSGEHVDGGTSRFDRRGVVYQAVCGGCQGSRPGFPVPPGANTYSATNGSPNCNNAAFKMDFGRQQASAGGQRAVCVRGGAVPLGGAPAGGSWAGPGVAGTLATGYRFDPALTGPGQYLLRYTVAVAGSCQATVTARYTVPPDVVTTLAVPPALCVSAAPVQLTASVPGGTFSGPGTTAAGVFSAPAAGPGLHTVTYELCDSLRGSALVTQQVAVAPQLLVQAGPDTTLCADQRQPFQLRGTNRPDGQWSGPGVTPGGFFTPPNTNNRGGIFDLTYTVVQPPCTGTDTRRVVLAPASLTNLPLNLPVCPVAPQYAGLAPFAVTVNALLTGGIYRWDFGDGTPVSTDENPTHRYERPGSYRISLEARYANCETVARFAPIEIGEVFVPNIITPNRPGTVGDTLNETFRPRFSCRPASLKIFSRWGQEVYKTAAYHNDWSAAGLADGIYFYLLQDDEGRSQKGWLEVRGR